MRRCPYCEAEISETARKCRHCGEWVTDPPPDRTARRRPLGARDLLATPDRRDDDRSLGAAANEWVRHHKAMSVIGLIAFALFFLFVFAPMACEVREAQQRFDRGPLGGGVVPADLRPAVGD